MSLAGSKPFSNTTEFEALEAAGTENDIAGQGDEVPFELDNDVMEGACTVAKLDPGCFDVQLVNVWNNDRQIFVPSEGETDARPLHIVSNDRVITE